MRYTQTLTLPEYYLWRKKAETAYPWMRQHLDKQFLEYEKKKITKLSEWRNKFLKADVNTLLEKVDLYTIPVELSTTWKGAIANLGNYKCIGLSALYNSPQALLLAILPARIKQPNDYRLIEIKHPKKIYVFNQRLNAVEPMILIEERSDWKHLKSDGVYPYKDISYERNVIQKIFEENLGVQKHIAQSFQAPVISAPYDGSVGGISLASLAWRSSFAKELSKTIQRMVPPEYREFKPPKSAYSGSKFQYQTGIEFHPAERPFVDENLLSSFCTPSYDGLSNKLSYRHSFKGEYSIFSTIRTTRGDITHAWNELMSNFTATEVTLPENIDSLPIEADVELTQLIKAINEDLWLQVVYARQQPANLSGEIDTELIDLVSRLTEDYDVLLTDVVRNRDAREYIVRSYLQQSQNNVKRISQSFARSDDANTVTSNHLNQARKLLVANFEGVVNHPDPDFRGLVSGMKKYSLKKSPRYLVLQTEIINHPGSNVREIFEAVRSTRRFRDIYDLQGFLDWLHTRGYVSVDRDNRYTWVGSRESLF